jgi:DNA-binding XRE family transcriptional regulator
MTDLTADIRNLLRAGRALLNLSQGELSERAGVSRSAIAHIEQNKPVVTTVLDKVKDALEHGGVVFVDPCDDHSGAVGMRPRKKR